ncbi:hypothetical protein B6I21_01905 [candidate division KSB1 bacterium 4572_119]|nr:MAG: hypothetical protein B6I21_01905 [candidate division KSB1 bacterium 4572_119]
MKTKTPVKLMVSEDTKLMLDVKNGDQEAFRELVEKHKLSVLNLCLRFTGNKDEADDLAQDVFMRVYQAAPRYEAKASFTTWLYRITLNLCLNFQRRKKLLTFFSLDQNSNNQYNKSTEIPITSDQPDTNFEKQEKQRIIQEAINSLPENQKTVVILYRYQQLSYQEIASVLETSVSAVESRLFRARHNLKKRLEPYQK